MTATVRAGPFGKLLRVREADERAIVELSDTRKLQPAGRSNDELTNGRSMARHKKETALSLSLLRRAARAPWSACTANYM